MKDTFFIIISILLICTSILYADTHEHEAENGNGNNNFEQENGEDEDKTGLVPVPILAYTPETSVMLGGNLMYVWNREGATSEDKPDLINLFAIYTTLNQVIVGLSTINYFDYFMLKNGLLFRRYPDRFYGIGMETTSDMREDYIALDFKARTSMLFKIVPILHIGPRYEFGLYNIDERDENGQLSLGTIPGSEGTHVSGLGFEVILDTRDSYFYPATGFFLQLIIVRYQEFLGSKYNFYRIEFDYRQFFRIYRMHIFALQYFMQIGGDDIPFQMMPALGGAHKMRGYFEGRYRDKNYLTIQGEYRFPIVWRLSGVAFYSIGEVAPTPQQLDFQDIKMSGGIGLRFSIFRQRRINFRVDFALYDFRFRPDTYGTYFYITEAF